MRTSIFTLNCNGKLITINHPIVMGIINTTPDSFYADSRKNTVEASLIQAEKMLQEGAAIIDIGGQSTKPNSVIIATTEELQRVIPSIEAIKKQFPDSIISIDTFNATVAAEAIQAGASIVNDVSGGFMDTSMISTVAQFNVPYICMHMKGTPQNMQQNPLYENVTKEVLDYFIERTNTCSQAGIQDIIIDIGFGFGKKIVHNFQLLRELSVFKMLQKPILIGVSRKSTIYKTLGITAEEALNGTTVLHTIGLLNGANILRVHDVKEAVECVQLFKAYQA
jgi:dihydropteroate synthase